MPVCKEAGGGRESRHEVCLERLWRVGETFPEKFTLSASSCIFVRPTVCVR